MPDFRRGKAEIAKANEAAKSGGNKDFRPFLPTFYWKDDGDQRFLLILNPAEEIPMALTHSKVWTSEGRPYVVLARTDQAIGESNDPLEDQWDYVPQDLNLAIAVELEVETEVLRGRPRPVSFAVKTRTFERRIRDESGELTEERESITAPEVGLIAQSPNNFFNHVASKDNTVGPIHEIPICVTRVGKDKNTDYEVDCFEDKELDISGLLEFVDGITYLNDEMDEILKDIQDLEPFEASAYIGGVLLDKRLQELASEEYYNEVLGLVEEPSRYGKRGRNKSAPKEKEKKASRPSQVRSRTAKPSEEEKEDEAPKRSRTPISQRSASTRQRLEEARAKAEQAKAARA